MKPEGTPCSDMNPVMADSGRSGPKGRSYGSIKAPSILRIQLRKEYKDPAAVTRCRHIAQGSTSSKEGDYMAHSSIASSLTADQLTNRASSS